MANELQRSKRIIIDKSYEDKINPDNLKLLGKYKRDMEMRGLSDKSIYNYVRDIMQWLSYLVREQYNPNVIDVNDEDIEEFIYYCKQEGNNENRILRRISSISAFFKFLRRKKIISENPMEFFVRPKKGLPVVVQTYLTKEQYEEMREKLSKCGNFQLYVFAMFAISTMARVAALSNITWAQIDIDERFVEDVLEKEGKLVTLYFSDEVADLLREFRKQRPDAEYLFSTKSDGVYTKVAENTLRKWAQRVGEMIDVPTLHPHDFRHSGSQLLKLAGMPIEDISEFLNHAGLDVTRKHYLRADKGKMKEQKDKFKF